MTDDIVARLREGCVINRDFNLCDVDEAATDTLMAKAADEIDRLQGEVERLTRECDDAKHHAEARLTALREVEDELAAAEAKVAKLREVLKPFAAEVEFCDEQTRVLGAPSLNDDDGIDVSVGDLRRARTALQETEQ